MAGTDGRVVVYVVFHLLHLVVNVVAIS